MNLKNICLLEKTSNKKKTIKGEGSLCQLQIKNNQAKCVEIYDIEDCITPIGQSSCDSLFIIDEKLHLAEFKGSNTSKACSQIEESIIYLLKCSEFKSYFQNNNIAIIIGKCNSLTATTHMSIMEKLKKNYNCKLIIRTRVYELVV